MRTISVYTEVTVDVDLDDISTDDLLEEVARRNQSAPGHSQGNVLRRIVRDHYVLGVPLGQVVDDLLREYGVDRTATAAFAGDD